MYTVESNYAIINNIKTYANHIKHPIHVSYCQCTDPANAGDYYSEWLIRQLGFPVILDHQTPQIYITGSILGTPLRPTPGIIWGLGVGNDDDTVANHNITTAVRGYLTQTKLKAKCVSGDPGCLASLFVSSTWTPHTKPIIGIIPHYIDEVNFQNQFPSSDKIEFRLISMKTTDITKLLMSISACDFIVSSSLHGIIFAHAYGKPCLHIELAELASKNNYKFRDYFTNISNLDHASCHIKLTSPASLRTLDWLQLLDHLDAYVPCMDDIIDMQHNLLAAFPLKCNSLHSIHEPLSKLYNGEKGIISLTSWTKRIHNVGQTIFSLLKHCSGFHITLVLSATEFPNGLKDLPRDIQLLSESKKIEILWVSQNLKSLKKVLYTIEHYPYVPVISADDDLIYTCNYANELYNLWVLNPSKICTINAEQPLHTNGTATLYYPGCFGRDPINELLNNKHLDIYMNADDGYYELLRARYNIKVSYLHPHTIWIDQNADCPLHNIYGKPGYLDYLRRIQSEDLGRPIGL